MAIAFDADLGSSDAAFNAAKTLTTIAAAAAATRIVVELSWFDTLGQTITSVADNAGGTYTLDKQTTNGSDKFAVYSRHAASGLASGAVITVTFSGNPAGGFLMGAYSLTGVASTGALVTTASGTGTAAAWSSGAATNTGFADAVYVGGAGNEDPTAGTSSTATSGTEVHDRYRAADGQGIATGYKIVSTVASDSIAGNWSNAGSTANTGALAVYAAAAVSSAPFVPRRMPLGV